MPNLAELPEDKYYFDELRKINGKLTQDQVNAAKQLFVLGHRSVLRRMLGLTSAHADDMTTSVIGQDFIKSFEALKLTAYKPVPTDPWTIGWGTTVYPDGTRVRQGDVITRAQADQFFAHDLKNFEDAVNETIKVPMSQGLFDALVSFTYNNGVTNFREGTVDDRINAGDLNGAYKVWAQYINSGGRPYDGLKRRRLAEIEMAKTR